MVSNKWVVFSDFEVVNNFENLFLFFKLWRWKVDCWQLMVQKWYWSLLDICQCLEIHTAGCHNRKGCSWHLERRLQMALNSVQAQDGISFPIPVLHTHPQHKQNPKYKLAPNVNSITFEKTVVETHGLGTGSTTGSPVCFGGRSHASAPPSAVLRTAHQHSQHQGDSQENLPAVFPWFCGWS